MRRLGRDDDNAALIAALMKADYLSEACAVTLALVQSQEGKRANGRAARAMIEQGNLPLVTKVQAIPLEKK